jgi:hypothetical protein
MKINKGKYHDQWGLGFEVIYDLYVTYIVLTIGPFYVEFVFGEE